MPENSNLENPIYHIIRALSPVPSHLAEFYSHKEVVSRARYLLRYGEAASGLYCGLC